MALFLPHLHKLRYTLKRWQVEHRSVANAATTVNLRHLRWMALVMVVLSAVQVLLLGLQLQSGQHGGQALSWLRGQFQAHLVMVLAMVACSVAVRCVNPLHPSRWGRWLPTATVILGLLFAIVLVTIDQWVTPNITPFLVCSLLVSVVFYLRPLQSGVLYLLASVGYFYSIGLTQHNPDQLLSNRLNGVAIGVLSWILTVVMWRNFTTITRQQRQLSKVNLKLQARQADLEHLNRHDGLTGLFNRQTLKQMTEQELARARRQSSITSLLLLDLDYFKRINDKHGHPAGDAVLRHVAALLSARVRCTDVVGRLGGEEFMVLLPGTASDAARKLAEKLCRDIDVNSMVWQGVTIPCQVSIGLASTEAVPGFDFEKLYSASDAALYQAKQQGRNRVVAHSSLPG
ncbi:MAG: GGDEF domain-containing protein [Pseudomonadota bacterium]